MVNAESGKWKVVKEEIFEMESGKQAVIGIDACIYRFC